MSVSLMRLRGAWWLVLTIGGVDHLMPIGSALPLVRALGKAMRAAVAITPEREDDVRDHVSRCYAADCITCGRTEL